MKKSLLAVLVAGVVSAPAFAGTQGPNVEVYGVVDAFVASEKVSNANRESAVESGGLSASRIGFKGSEALGNGVKLKFKLERSFNTDDGSDADAFDRHATVSLDSKYGEISLGREKTLTYKLLEANDVLGEASFGVTQRAFGDLGIVDRVDNSVRYAAPAISGVRVEAQYVATENTLDKAYAVSASYDNGPLSTGVAYEDWNDNANRESKILSVGGTYDLKVAKVFANYSDGELSGAADVDSKLWSIGASTTVGAGTLVASYGETERDDGLSDVNAERYAVGYLYPMSKRTQLYTLYANEHNDDSGVAETQTFGVGVNHAF